MHKGPKYDKKVAENAKFYTLSAAVYSVLEDIQAGEERFNHFLKFAVDGYREFHFNASHEVCVDVIEMKPHRQIDFPCNFVDWEKIGFKIGNSIAVFTQDRNIPKTFDIIDCIPQENADVPFLSQTMLTDELLPFFWDGSTSDHYYGATVKGNNYHGYFDVDWKNRVFNFKRTMPGQTMVYLEYITDGINPTGRTVIPEKAFKCIQDYIHWQRKEHDDRVSLGEKDRAMRIYQNSFDKVLVLNLNLSLEDIKEALRAGNTQSPKG